MRHKRFSQFIDEILYLKKTYGLEFLRFWDETFLSLPRRYLEDFAAFYKKEIGLPFTIETTAHSVTEDNARMLAEMECLSVSIGVETSNEKLRKEVLNKPIPNEAHDRCFKILTKYGLRKVANFMFFLPHQTLEDMWNDVRLCNQWKIDHPSARIFYPYRGTDLREYCLKNDMIDLNRLAKIEDEEAVQNINSLNENYVTFQDTVLKVDSKTKEDGKRIMDNFILFQESEPSQYAFIETLLQRDDDDACHLLREMEYRIYKKRFGEEPILQ